MCAGAVNHANPAPVPKLDPGIDPGLAFQLPADAYYHLIHTLRLTLPPPPTDDPGALLRRDHAAIARIAALAPANAAEADVAAQFVAASEQWKDCLSLAQDPELTPQWAAKCRAQALAMMRQANSALRLLLRLQAARGKREADTEATDRAAWTEHCAIGLMAEALAAAPEPAPVREAQGASPPHPAGGRGEGSADSQAPERGAEFAPDLMEAAERYAAAYPERAAAIHRTGRLPSDVRYFDPPEAALARVLIAAPTPALAALADLPATEANRIPDLARAI